jgi:CRP-like cAMP-binding protein
MQLSQAIVEQGEPVIGAVQRTLILKTFPGFAKIGAEELSIMAAIARERFFAAGETLHHPGKPVQAFHLIFQGNVQQFRGGKPSQVLGPRSTVGGLAALSGDPNGTHAVAMEDVIALEIDAEDMDDVFEDHFSMIQAVIGSLAGTLRTAQMRMGGGAAVDNKRPPALVPTTRTLTLVDKMFALKSATNFAEASIEALANLAHGTTERRYRAGEGIWRAGERADYSILLVEGLVECEAEGVKPFPFGPGYYVGGLDSLSDHDRWYDCRASTEVVALTMERQKLFDVLEDHTEMGIQMMRTLARGVNALMERMMARESAPPPAAASE